MLRWIEVGSTSDRLPILQEFNSAKATWIVSDLSHKKELQNFYLLKDGHLEESACLRAREFWQKLLQRYGSSRRVVSADFLRVLLSDWLRQQDFAWAQGGTSTQTLISYLDLFAPVFISEDGPDLIRSWLKENPLSLMKWGAWFEITDRAWQFLSRQNVTTSSWCAALLQAELEVHQTAPWDRSLFVDVGSELSATEAQVFKNLSRFLDVTVLFPSKVIQNQFPKTLSAYRLLVDQEIMATGDEVVEAAAQNLSCIQAATRLSEVKMLTAKVRSWLESGIAPTDIAIYARDPEVYWPSLSSHLQFEGVPVAKDQVAALASFPALSQWLSALRSHLDKVSSEDLEGWIFAADDRCLTSYQRFRTFLSNIYEPEDLHFLPELKRESSNVWSREESVLRDEFVLWSLPFYSDSQSLSELEPVISRLITECPASQKLKLQAWIQITEAIISKSEVVLRKGAAEGVQVRKLEFAFWETRPYRILLGLSQSDLSDNSRLAISPNEVQRLATDLGFHLQMAESGRFDLLTTINTAVPAKDLLLSYPVHDFGGEALAPAVIWSVNELKFGKSTIEFQSDSACRWDQLQNIGLDEISALSSLPRAQLFTNRLRIDKGELPLEPVPLLKPATLSASQLKAYGDCGFKFFAAKGLNLKDEPELSLDIDRLRRGRLTHKIFELIVKRGLSAPWDQERLAELIESAVVEEKVKLFKTLWPFQKQKLVQMASRFVEFERQWKSRFPAVEVVSTEVPFEGQLFGHLFRGKIDRIDRCHDGSYIVIDYKSSGYNVNNHTKWVSEGEFQLFLYSYAVENGWTELAPGKCIGAVYYDVKTFTRNKGFLNEEFSDSYEVSGRSGAAISSTELDDLRRQCLEQIEELCRKVESGEFSPTPKDPESSCPSCEWKLLCRATHLNI